MKYTKEQKLDIGRRLYEGELSRYQVAAAYGIHEHTARNYMRLYRDANNLPPKAQYYRIQTGLSYTKPVSIEPGQEDYESMTKEELIREIMRCKIREAAVLTYFAETGKTTITGYNGKLYSHDDLTTAYEDIRNGVLELDDEVCINTTNNSLRKTDWVLTYSISAKAFTQYEEKTNSQGHNAMGAGGERKLVSFRDGKLHGKQG